MSEQGVPDASVDPVALPLRIGNRTVGRVRRRLVCVSVPLEDALAGRGPALPPLPREAHGYLVRALPEASLGAGENWPGLRPFIRQTYPHHYADLSLGFDTYLAGFAGKTRSSLKRKQRKLAERSGGALDLRLYIRPEEMEAFHAGARAVSALTYQERLLDAGMPEDALPDLRRLAERDAVRGWLLWMDGRPISYLYAPAAGDALLYAFLGYDPAFADLSPGTVLQLEAMRMLMEEGRFRWFDFTEGDGQHKRQFATGSIPSLDLLLLRRSLPNLAAGHVLAGFDRSVALAKRAVTGLGLQGVARAVRR